MADKNINVKVNIKEPDIQPTIAELKKLKLQLREVTDPAEFKALQQQINDTEDAIRAARVGADNFAEVLGTLPGPIGQIGNAVGGTLQSLKQFGSLKFKDLKASFVDLGKDIVDAAKGIGNLTGITKVYTTINTALASSFVKVGVGEQAAAVGARAFSAALTATGIGAIVVVVGLLADKLIELGTAFFNQGEVIKKKSEELKTQYAEGSKVFSALAERDISEAKRQGKSAEELYDLKITLLQKEREDLFEQQAEQDKLQAEEIKKARGKEEKIKEINERYGKETNARTIRQIQIDTAYNNIEIEEDQRVAAIKKGISDKAAAEDAKRIQKEEQDRLKAEAKRESDLKKIEENEKEASLSLFEIREQEMRKIVADYDEKINLAAQYGKDVIVLQDAREKALRELNAKFAQEDKEKTEKDLQEKLDLINKEYEFKLQIADKIKSLENQTAEQTFRNNRLVAESWVDLGNNIAGVFGSLINVFENGSDAAKAFGVLQVAVNAASSIGQILLNSQAGQFEYNKAIATGNAAILMSIPKLVNPITAPLGIAEAAAGKAAVTGAIAGKAALKTSTALQIGTVGVTSAAQIAAILSSGKSRGSSGGTSSAGGGGGSATIAVPSVSQLTVPQLNTTGGQNPSEQIAETLATAQKPLRAYVVSGEITSQQALDRRTNRAATFG